MPEITEAGAPVAGAAGNVPNPKVAVPDLQPEDIGWNPPVGGATVVTEGADAHEGQADPEPQDPPAPREAPTDDAPVEGDAAAPLDEVPAVDAPAEETPAVEEPAPAEETPAVDVPAEVVPDAPVEEAPADPSTLVLPMTVTLDAADTEVAADASVDPAVDQTVADILGAATIDAAADRDDTTV